MSNSQQALTDLAQAWTQAKTDERNANARRLEIEKRILEIEPAKEEGSRTITLENGVKIITTGKLSYKANMSDLGDITCDWPADFQPVKMKIEADEAILKTLRQYRPDLWRQIAGTVTVKPAKTALTVEEI
jgi:SMC interacting uncharacterized protein involved in chromosome segregation